METKQVKVHSCFQVKKGLEKDTPLSPKKCRCRQYMSVIEAATFVGRGLAQYVVTGEKSTETEEVCSICAGVDNLKKVCTACGKTGVIKSKKVFDIRGEDIIFISLDGTKNPKTTQVKKSPTLEKAHMQRAAEGNREEQARIEVYGATAREFLASLGAEIRNPDTGEVLVPGKPEPADDIKTWTGRTYDYGRGV